MDIGEILTRWTVRIALVCYVAALALRLTGQRRSYQRLAWTAGCLAYLVHVACAFHFNHGWSHAAALAETARQTEEMFGFSWGGGLYFNYVFTAVWILDVLWWWLDPPWYETRPRWIEWSVQGFLAFMFFNATVVFATGPARW